jgi:hypothetical protein
MGPSTQELHSCSRAPCYGEMQVLGALAAGSRVVVNHQSTIPAMCILRVCWCMHGHVLTGSHMTEEFLFM